MLVPLVRSIVLKVVTLMSMATAIAVVVVMSGFDDSADDGFAWA